MKLAALFLFSVLFLSLPPAQAAETTAKPAASQSYKNVEYGFSLSYPAGWQVFEHVNAPYVAQGLPSVFALCLTPGPVKTLSCPAAFYVIPEAKFVPPTKTAFLGLPSAKMDTYNAEPVWGEFHGEPFTVAHSASAAGNPAALGSTNHYVTRNGFVYLWSDEGGFDLQDPWRTMLSSVQFFKPAAPATTCIANEDCTAYCKGAGLGKECKADGVPVCDKGACTCALTCL